VLESEGQRAGELTRREQASNSNIGSRNMSFIRVDDSAPGHHAGRTATSSSSWVVMKDNTSGKAYYYNRRYVTASLSSLFALN
jgi:hypothetical protein